MNDLQIFNNAEFGEFSLLEENGKLFFPATLCAEVLGYSNPRDAILKHCKGVVKRDVLTDGGTQDTNFIPEGDLYRLIARSKLPAAERFERWVFDEVLPSIRRAGRYAMPTVPEASISIPSVLECQLNDAKKIAAVLGVSDQDAAIAALEATEKQTGAQLLLCFISLLYFKLTIIKNVIEINRINVFKHINQIDKFFGRYVFHHV